MASLYVRATPRQARVLRIVEGAVRNAAHAHPGRTIDGRMARSIAKRAAGTLTAQWPDVLALPRAASHTDAATLDSGGAGCGDTRAIAATGRASQLVKVRALHRLHVAIGRLAKDARRAGSAERQAALVDVLRLISNEMRGDTAQGGEAEGGDAEGGSVHEHPVREADAP